MLFAQGVGINNPTPHTSALLDLTSTNKGLLVPRMTTAQRDAIPVPATSLLVFNTSTARFEYFDGAAWVPLVSPGWSLTGNTGTDPALNFLGTTNAQPLRFRVNNVNAGFIHSGTSRNIALGIGANQQLIASGSGGTGIVSIGDSAGFSTFGAALGNTFVGTRAGRNNLSGYQNTYIGNRAGFAAGLGIHNTTLGNESGRWITSSSGSTMIGSGAGQDLATGSNNSAFGRSTRFGATSMNNATVIGASAQVDQNNSIVLGSIAGVNGAGTTVNVGIGTTSPLDRLHVVGSIRMVDGNQSAGHVLISDANGRATWTAPGAGTSGTLDQSYDFGGAGAGRTIVADNGPVRINGNAGFLVTGGTLGSGPVIETNGIGIRMFFNPNKAAFRAGAVGGTMWDNENIGQYSFATNINTTASGSYSSAFGFNTFAVGETSFASGNGSQALGNRSTAIGQQNFARSFGELVLGIGATNYTPSATGATAFGAANATDRLLVVGNALDSDDNGSVANSERSDALVILKNGNTGIGVSLPSQRLEVAGRSLFHNGFSADNAALLYRNNTDYMFIGPQSGSSANGGAIALYGSTNAVGGNTNGIDLNAPGGSVRLNHTGGNFEFRANSTSGYTATMELNDVGLQIGHNSLSRNIQIMNGGGERVRIDAAGRVGIGTTAPGTALHVNGALAMSPVTVLANAAPFFFDPGNRSYVRMDSDLTPGWRSIVLGSGMTQGQILVVECTATGGNGITFGDDTTQAVGGGFNGRIMFFQDTITLIWTGAKWLEIAFSDN